MQNQATPDIEQKPASCPAEDVANFELLETVEPGATAEDLRCS